MSVVIEQTATSFTMARKPASSPSASSSVATRNRKMKESAGMVTGSAGQPEVEADPSKMANSSGLRLSDFSAARLAPVTTGTVIVNEP